MPLNKINIESLSSLQSLCIDDILRNGFLFTLFDNQDELEFCVKTELDILKNFLISSSYDTKQYISSGKRYFQAGISLATIDEIVNFLLNKIVEFYCMTQNLQQIVELYEVSLDFQTQGYFYSSFDYFLDRLRKRNKQHDNTNLQSLFTLHLSWLENMYMEVQRTGLYDAMLVRNTPFTDKLTLYKKQYQKFSDDFEQLLTLYARFYKQILILHYMLERENYTRAYELVQSIELLTVEIESSLSIINVLEIEHENRYDALTNALSRRLMLPIFEKEMDIVQISGKSLIVAMLDIDDFKVVNDTYGHLCGDEVLKRVVKVCKKHLRSTDYIFRYGGEEFVILLNAVNLSISVDIFEAMRKKIANCVVTCRDGNRVSVTVSIGVHQILSPDKNDFLSFIEKADKNLYKAKANGKNMVFFEKLE